MGERAGLGTWLKAARYIALPQALIPCLLGGLVALSHEQFDILRFVIAFIGIAIVTSGTYLLDDYFDYRAGSTFIREEVERIESAGIKPRPALTKCYYILNGTIRLEDVFRVGVGCLIIGGLIGIYLTLVSGWMVLWLSLAGAMICYFYSAPPLKLGYRGLGEITVALTMGPMISLGTYYVLTQDINLEPIIVSIPIGVLIGTVLYVHSIMDFDADKAAGKKTLAGLLGQGRSIRMLPLPFVISYGVLVAGVILKILPLIMLIALLTIPMAYKLIQLMNRLAKGDPSNTSRAWWMGPMEMWNEPFIVVMRGFMIRWYLARNLFIVTTLLIFIGYIVILVS